MRWVGVALGILVVGFAAAKFARPRDVGVYGVRFSLEEIEKILQLSPLPPAPPSHGNAVADHEVAARFGRRLFYETRLSGDGTVSCATCHQPDLDWTDGKAVSVGMGTTTRNAPSIWNAAHNRWQFWDGRADSLWAQSLGPIESPAEMGGHRLSVCGLIVNVPEYNALYEEIFGAISTQPFAREIQDMDSDNVSKRWKALSESHRETVNQVFANVGKALEAFERRLISDNSAFDQFVTALRERNAQALSAALPESAVRGLKIFVGRGRCLLCHTGPNFTDREFHNIGLDQGRGGADTGRYDGIGQVKASPFNGMGPYSSDRSDEANIALRYLARKPNNLGEFKTPTLRNVARTAPYMRDGRFQSLREVVEFYSRLDQTPAMGHREESLQPLDLSERDVEDLVSFLQALTDPEPPVNIGPPGAHLNF